MRIHKLSLIAALALGSLLVSTTLSSAQDAKEGKKRGRFSPAEQVERLTTELKLTDAQKAKVTALIEDTQKKMRELRAENSVPRDQLQEKAKAIRDERETKMKAILTPEQWTKYEKIRDEQRERIRERRGDKAEKKTQ